MRRDKLAISINGGGALGIGPVALMVELEKHLPEGKTLADICFAFGGTSTGAIVAALLNEGCSAADIHKLYRENLKLIFKKYPWYRRLLDWKCPTYDHSHLKALLQEKMKGSCDRWEKPIFIPVTRMNGKSVEKVWDRGDSMTEKWFAVLTSTSAPTYFDVEFDERKKYCYCDGGMWANSPIAVLNAGLNKTEHRGTYRILTFDTDMDMMVRAKGNKTLLGWGSYVLNEWVARSGKSSDYEVMADIGKENVYVLSPSAHGERIPMDDVSDATLDKLEKIWVKYFYKHKKEILDFVNNA